MPEITVDIDIYCDTCGADLYQQVDDTDGKFYIEPCETCIKAAREEGFEVGHVQAEEEE